MYEAILTGRSRCLCAVTKTRLASSADSTPCCTTVRARQVCALSVTSLRGIAQQALIATRVPGKNCTWHRVHLRRCPMNWNTAQDGTAITSGDCGHKRNSCSTKVMECKMYNSSSTPQRCSKLFSIWLAPQIGELVRMDGEEMACACTRIQNLHF